MAKVSDVLKLSVMRGVRVVAGEEGLFRKVEHVTVMEVPGDQEVASREMIF